MGAISGLIGGVGEGAGRGIENVGRLQHVFNEAELQPSRLETSKNQATATGLDLEKKKQEAAALKLPWDHSQYTNHMSPEDKAYFEHAHGQLPKEIQNTQYAKALLWNSMNSDLAMAKVGRDTVAQFGGPRLEKLSSDYSGAMNAALEATDPAIKKVKQAEAAKIKQEYDKHRSTYDGALAAADERVNNLSVKATFEGFTPTQQKKAKPLMDTFNNSIGDERKEAKKRFDKLIDSFGKGKGAPVKTVKMDDGRVLLLYEDGSKAFEKSGPKQKAPVDHAPSQDDKNYASYEARMKKAGLKPGQYYAKDQWADWWDRTKAERRKKGGGGAATNTANEREGKSAPSDDPFNLKGKQAPADEEEEE